MKEEFNKIKRFEKSEEVRKGISSKRVIKKWIKSNRDLKILTRYFYGEKILS